MAAQTVAVAHANLVVAVWMELVTQAMTVMGSAETMQMPFA